QDDQYNDDRGICADAAQGGKFFQPLYGRSDGNGRCDDAIGQQGGTAYHGGHNEPFFAPPHQRIQGKSAAFTPVICPQDKDDIFDSGLKRERPDDAGKGADDEVFTYFAAADNGIKNVKRGGADISVNNSECYD